MRQQIERVDVAKLDEMANDILRLAGELRQQVRENRQRWERLHEEAAISAVQSELNRVTWGVH